MWPTTALFQNLTSQPFKRAQLGLFQGKTRLSGNNVPFSKHKTRRTWLPNVQRKRLFSDTLGQNVSVKLTTRALRTIKKHGGIDNYVQKTRSELLGWEGMKLRTRIKDKKELDALEASEYTPEEARQILESITATPPSLALAAAERERVQLALGLESLPSAAQTIAFLEKERTDLEKALQ